MKRTKSFVYSDFGFILMFGCLYLGVLSAIWDLFFKGSFVVKDDVLSVVLQTFIAVDIAIWGLSPVFVNQVRNNIKESLSAKKRKKTEARFSSLLESFCIGTIIWSILLFVLCVIDLLCASSFLFVIIACFELAILTVYAISCSMMLRDSWPVTFTQNVLKEESKSIIKGK